MVRVRGGAAGEAQDRGGDARAARLQGGILRASVVAAFAHLDVVTADVRVQFEHLRHDGSAGAVQAANEDLLGRHDVNFSTRRLRPGPPMRSTATLKFAH